MQGECLCLSGPYYNEFFIGHHQILRKIIQRQSGEDPGFIPYGEISEHQEQFDENEETDDEESRSQD